MGHSDPSRPHMRTAVTITFLFMFLVSISAQQVYRPRSPAPVFVWTGSDDPGFEYPELSTRGGWGIPALQAKPNLGIALSGGGYRAATLSLGWIRGLYMLGVLPLTRYISSNSGGSWLNGAMSYGGFPVGPFLGPYAPPGNLSRDLLGSSALLPPGCFGDTLASKSIIADAIKGVLTDLVVPGRESFSGWTEAIARAFLEPYGLDLQNSSITAHGTRGQVSTRLAEAYPGVPLYTAMTTPDRPLPIILGSIMRIDTPQIFFPFEATPLYVGAPARNFNILPPLGPGFIEPLGFNSPAPDKHPLPSASVVGLQGPVNVTPVKLVPLATYLGISSSFVSQEVRPSSSAGYALTGTERLNYWSPTNYTGETMSFADGAGADNLAITPLLRRRVLHIVACVAALHPADRSPADWAVAQYDVAGLFGAVPANATSYEELKHGINGIEPSDYNKDRQVFPREAYDELYDSLRGGMIHGQPAIHRASYSVLSNPMQAIIGGWRVEVLWMFNMQARQWEELLPNETQEFLNLSRGDTGSDMHQYPYISTFSTNYSPQLVTLLSQQATWTVLQAAPELLDLLEMAGVSAPTPGENNITANNTTNTTYNATPAGVGRGNRTATSAGGASFPGVSEANITAHTSGAHNRTTPGKVGDMVAAMIELNSSSLTSLEARAAAALVQLAEAGPQEQLAGAVPEMAQVEQLTGGLPESVRQPRNSYTMAVGPATILQPSANESFSGGASRQLWRSAVVTFAFCAATTAVWCLSSVAPGY